MQMRRPLAILMVLFFALGPLQGVLGASDDSRLPACCRRNGAHHCEMNAEMMAMMQRAYGSSPAFDAPDTCPMFPGLGAGYSTPSHAVMPALASFPILRERSMTPVAVNVQTRTFPVGTADGRAPPACL
jgi:hypothetical protein